MNSEYLINPGEYITENHIKPEEAEYMMGPIQATEKGMFDFIMLLIM